MQISFERVNSFLNTVDKRYVKLASCSAYFGIGALFGLTLRSYLRILFLCTIICFFFIKGLQMGNILSFNWSVLNGFFGLPSSAGTKEVSAIILTWSRRHPAETISAAIGFFLGFRYG